MNSFENSVNSGDLIHNTKIICHKRKNIKSQLDYQKLQEIDQPEIFKNSTKQTAAIQKCKITTIKVLTQS